MQLHILKDSSNNEARAIIASLADKNCDSVRVVLILDGRNMRPDWKCKTYWLNEEGETLAPAGIEVINMDRLVDLISEADSVVPW